MAGNRPRGRQKNVTGSGKSIYKRGSGLGTGPVGSSGGYSGRPSGGGIGGGSGRGSRGPRNTRGGGGLGKLILLGLIVLFGGGGGLGSMLLGGGSGDTLVGVHIHQRPIFMVPDECIVVGVLGYEAVQLIL